MDYQGRASVIRQAGNTCRYLDNFGYHENRIQWFFIHFKKNKSEKLYFEIKITSYSGNVLLANQNAHGDYSV